MNGIRYVLRYGIPWDAMPKDLPPSSLCYDYWRLLPDGAHMERINHHLVMADREKAGREASPTVAIIDAQSVKCDAPQGERGYDAGKKVLGRKKTYRGGQRRPPACRGDHLCQVQDQNGGIPLVKRLVRLCPWIKTVVVDGGYKTLHRGRPGDREPCRRGRQTARFRQRLRALAQTMESRANHRGVDDLAPAQG